MPAFSTLRKVKTFARFSLATEQGGHLLIFPAHKVHLFFKTSGFLTKFFRIQGCGLVKAFAGQLQLTERFIDVGASM